MEEHPYRYPVRCASCACLYYPRLRSEYMCEVCQGSLEDYVRSLEGMGGNPVMAWWDRQRSLRESAITRR